MSFAPYVFRRMLSRNTAVRREFHRSSAAWAAKKVVQRFKLADIGEGITECEVIKWSVKPMSVVQAFDPLCEVQSDKASVEITSPFDGVVKDIIVKEGEIAKVGADLCTIEVDSEVGDEVGVIEDTPSKASPSSTISPHGETISTERATEESVKVNRKSHPLDPRIAKSAVREATSNQADVLALPSVRHFAKQNGLDISLLAPGSGRSGRVEKVDVENYLARTTSTHDEGAGSSSKSTLDKPIQEDAVVELGRTRYNMWKAMVKSLEIPHFGYSTYLDLTNLDALLPLLNSHIPIHYLKSPPEQSSQAVSPSAIYPAPPPPDVPTTGKYSRLTHLPFMLKTLSRAMADWPLFRSSITTSTSEGSKPTLTVRPYADISIALSTPTGLYSPTIQNVNSYSVYSLASQIAHVAALGRRTPSGLTLAEMPKRGGTVTVSNVGAIGAGEFASPVLVPGGGVAIVAIGRAKWVRDEEMPEGQQRRLRVGISWSADHRVVEGAELAAFVESWRSWIEHPERLIAEGV